MDTQHPVAGAWDTHVHAGPDVTDRKHDIVELARRAAAAGMGGLVLKNHHAPTTMAAALVEQACDSDIRLASTVVLNRSVGGINIDAVVAAAKMGASRVELPTMTAKRNMLEQGEPKTIDLLNGNDELKDGVWSVLTEAINDGMVVGTGHIGVEEVEAVVDAVTEVDGEVIVTHPEFHAARDGVGLTPERQARLARDGVYFERCSIVTDETVRELFLPDAPEAAHDAFADGAMFDKIVAGIEATGPEHNLLSTDYGQPGRMSPPDALAAFHADLESAGIPRADIERMARDNPETIFGGA
ncbi:hypothetical protein KY092_09790 [Natronomonas gomsonensis]|uniref:DUF6282 family protein n=1 Tax=Natronomonas gomsonensis TaxID=1046043 RepID=UPI0020CA88E8|nr:DUF6282 family protein [Natronomonas gomsonensis]MCY4730848.1 hypothetical protein [Natronomonas gomsonensis]